MIIELQRAHTPNDYGREEACEICGERFRVESVRATLVSDDGRDHLGEACDPCVGMLARRKPGRFPSLDELEAARARLRGPIWASVEEAEYAEEQNAHHYLAALEASRIEHTGAPPAR